MEKWVPIFIKNEIAGLRHFLPQHALLGFFFGRFFFDFLAAFFAHFRLLGFLRVSWEVSGPKKRVKTHGFLRFLKRLFKAPDGPLGLILVSLVNLF